MPINARTKGASGERQFCKWLKDNLKLTELPTRNLEQVRSGGADVLGVAPFVFEVKRVERLNKGKWWRQVKAASRHGEIPVVAYRQNRRPWKFLLPSSLIGLEFGYIELEGVTFKQWITKFLGVK